MPIFVYAASLTAVALAASFTVYSQQPPSVSPTQTRVAAAERRALAEPNSWQAQNDLAFAFCRAARDAEDVALYDKAEAAIQRSYALSPGNYDARKLEAAVLLGKHEFERAHKLAVELNRKVPDDIAGWALLVDTNVVLGNYPEAERAAQWILDLRAGSSLGFIKAAGLREIFGDAEGAAEFYEEAFKRTAQTDLDERAWLLTQDAREQVLMNKPERAEDLLKQAQQLFPASQLVLAELARLRQFQRRYKEAAELLGQRYKATRSAGNLYDWAEALEQAGERQQAGPSFDEFESRATAVSRNAFNWNLPLILFYTDHKLEPEKALSLAEREVTARRDSPTLDAYAWALYANGKYLDAAKQMQKALEPGVRDPRYLCHAAQIAYKTGATAASVRLGTDLPAFPSSSCAAGQQQQSGAGGMR